MNDFICSDTVQPRGHCGGLDDVPIRLVQVDESSRLVVRLLAEAHYHEADLLLAHAALLGNDCLQLSNSDAELTTTTTESDHDTATKCQCNPPNCLRDRTLRFLNVVLPDRIPPRGLYFPAPAQICTTSRGM